MSLLGKIRKYNSAAAKELENANFRTDSQIKSLDQTDLHELFPEKKNLKLRKDIIEIIHPKRPVKDLVRELKGFIPHESACASSGVVGDYLCILKEMKTQMDTVQTFINAHIDLLEDLSKDPPLHKTDALPAAKSSDPSGPATFSNCQTGHIPLETRGADLESDKNGVISPDLGNQLRHPREDSQGFSKSEKGKEEAGGGAGNSSDLLPSVLREVKYNMIVDGRTLNAHQQLMNELLSQQQVQDCQFSESSDDHQVTLLFKPISSRMESDVEAAMSRIKDNKPVILVLMHHVYEPKFTSQRILKDHPNVVLTVHVFFHETKSGLLTCRENSASISSIRDKLLEYSTLVIPGENLQGVSERRNLEAEGGEVLRCLESSRCTSAGDFDGTDCFSGAKTTDPSGPVTFSSPPIGQIPPGTPAGNSSDLLPSVLREVKYNMIVHGQTLNAHQQLMNELLSQQQAQDCQFSESSDDHQVTLLFKPISSRMESDVEAAMSRIKDNKPVILVLMHHVYEPKFTSQRILKDHPNVVLTVHVFFHETKSGLLTCRENSASISSIRDKLLEYSRLVIPGENLQGVSERRNLEAEGGEVLRCLERGRCTSAGDFDGTDCFSGAKTTDPSGPVTFSSPQIGHIPPGTPGNSSDLLPSVLREVKYNMIVDGQTLNAHQQLMNELLSQQQVQVCQFSESSDDHQVTLLFKSISSHMKSDIKAAMSRIKDNKPVILVLHHFYEPKFTSSPKILKDHPNVVLTVHVFVDWTKFRLLTCRENSASISSIRDKLLQYSTLVIPGENLKGVSERRNLEAEGGGKKQNFYDDQKSGEKSSDRQSSFWPSSWTFKR
ncbi:uncharacterized protein isoform X4 [Takifugu rubripes]|uniref:uncharacterized protein isoform X4 n=1 Tax=Takifugu rubripes TaxID=31033 RepID=UPI001145C088|nr:uncharacterized protein LOC105419261 isoform X4 [Takifugu rubripes]